jgi:signal transduction histidine kinase
MELSKRAYAALLVALAILLAVVPVVDVYDDYAQGEPLWLTLLENSAPLVLVLTLLGSTYWLYQYRDRTYLRMVSRWAIVGVVGILFILSWVLGSQAFQQQFKPVVVTAHTAIGGAIAGGAIGYTAAQTVQSRRDIETEKQRWQSLFENDPSGVADLRFDGETPRIETVNESFEDLFDVDAGAVDGEPLTDIVDHGNPDVEADITNAIENGETYAEDIKSMIAADILYFKLRVVPYGVGDHERRAFAIYTDVTDLRETEKQLEAQMERLEAANDRLQQFAYIASHDLQEPLRMVSSYMTLLEDEYREDLDEEAQEYIDYAVDGSERMQDMVDGLLEYSRVRTQGEEFTKTDANEILEEVCQNLELRIEESGATVESEELPTVDADRNQLGQVFQNLIENAIDHVEEPTIHVGTDRRENDVVFSVSDDGPGIPENQQEKIFNLFKRGSREGDGTGMGLAICDRIVSRHNGEMWVESTDGEGTTFYFSIPR